MASSTPRPSLCRSQRLAALLLAATSALAAPQCARSFTTFVPSFVASSSGRTGLADSRSSPGISTAAAAAADSSPSPLKSATSSDDPLGLTPELRKITNAFAAIPDEKTRYKQLLYMAGQLGPIPDGAMIPENKVPGCLSTVYVDVSAERDEERGRNVVTFYGDSDGVLTKGIVALLVRGLSGCTAEEVQRVNPEFIHEAKISQSLTPGRNNGFLNMLAVMKRKAAEVAGDDELADDDIVVSGDDAVVEDGEERDDGTAPSVFEERDGKPMYNAIMSTLTTTLNPTYIELVDNSDQHAGHAGASGWEESGESHFALDVVSDAFEGLSLVKRHQLVYMLLGDVMQNIHALQIAARTPEEAESRQ